MTAEYEKFYEEITLEAVKDTVTKLLKYPFGFHGDTGIRDYLYARLHVHGDERLNLDDPRPGHSTLLLQSEHYTRVKYINTGKTGKGARFDIALTLPPTESDSINDRYAENLNALFAFELGKNKALSKVINTDMLKHGNEIDAIPGTSDVSKLYLELRHHILRQGWAIEFYDPRVKNLATVVNKTFDICRGIELKEWKKLIIIFVGFSLEGTHYVSSNNKNAQEAIIQHLGDIGIDVVCDIDSFLPGNGMDPPYMPSASVDEIFEDRADFANRIIKIGEMDELGRLSQYVNLSYAGKKNVAQIHPHENGIALVLRSISDEQPKTSFSKIPVSSLAGYYKINKAWLNGTGSNFEKKGPAIAFLIPDEVDELDDNGKEWQEVVKLLDHAKTLS
jgi:hypothetical protein